MTSIMSAKPTAIGTVGTQMQEPARSWFTRAMLLLAAAPFCVACIACGMTAAPRALKASRAFPPLAFAQYSVNFGEVPAMPVIECSCGMVMSVAADDPRSSCIRCGGVEFRMMARRGASSYTAEAGHLPTSSELVGDSSSPLIFACIGSAVAGACHAGG